MLSMSEETWKCTIEVISSETEVKQVEFEFIDYDAIVKKSLLLKPNYFTELVQKANTYDNYHLSGGLVKIITPDGEDFSTRNFYLVLGAEKNNLLFGILIGEVDENHYKMVGFHPKELLLQVKNDTKILKSLPVLLLENIDMWQHVSIIGPSVKQN